MKRLISRLLILSLVITLFNVYGVKPINAKAAEADTNSNVYANVSYSVHCQTYGWLDTVSNGELSGTEGEAKRLEAIKIKVDSNLSGGVEYSVHCQTYGWLDTVSNGEISGTEGESKRLEGIKINLTGELEQKYDIYYRVHCQTYGWLDWVKNGEVAGTEGESKRLEAIQIKLVKKEGKLFSSVKYKTHVQTYGWQNYVYDGAMSGTEGESKRLEGIRIDLESVVSGGVTYRVHCQTYGWLDWVNNDAIAGTTGESKRLEAIQIKLTGEIAEIFDIYYRVHAQTYGWLDWASNGDYAGTAGLSKRLEGIEIKLVKKGGKAPGETKRPYVTKEDEEKKEPVIPGTPTESTKVEDILNSAQLYEPIYTNDAEIDKRVQEILSQIITEDMTTYEKTLAIYNWILDNNYYQAHSGRYRGSYASIYDTWCVAQSYSSLCLGYGSCVNYAAAFVVLTRAIGLESYKVFGALSSSGDHGWAVVNINGTLYTFDPQLGDEASGNGWGDRMDYFCKRDDEAPIKDNYINVDYEGLTRDDYINGFNYFKLQ